MELLTPFITTIVDSLMVPVKKHMGFFFSSSKYIENMTKKCSELNETVHDMKEKKKNATMNDQIIPDVVKRWLERAETITEEARNISTGRNECLSLKIRYKAGKSSFNLIKEIDDLLEKQNKIEWSNIQRPLGMVRSSTRASTSETVHDYDATPNIFPSRISIFNDVLKSLELENETQRMALWGPGGVGKTTMMEEIKKVVEKKGKFHYVLRVDIGTNYDPITTQKHIANLMGVTLTEETKEARIERLGKRFEEMSKSSNNILLIMDDVWDSIDLKDIGLTSPFPKGFKLLVTSRNEKACIKMDIDTNSIFNIHSLEEEDANSFFWDTVRISDADGELRKIGEDILKKCRGLPIAIKTIAMALRGEKKDAWELAKKSLQRHKLKDIEDLEDVAHTIFEISYNNLKKDDYKAVFVLCALFPDDFNIPLEELFMYGWGLQFFNDADSLDEARKRTNTSVDNLVRANLLTESYTTRCVKMHDLARSFVLSNISQFKQASIVNHGDKSEWPKQDTLEFCERILLKCKGMSELPEDFYYPNLVLLKLMNGDKLLELPESFHKRMEKLEVMAFDEVQNPLRAVSICYSTSLRTLCLYKCSLVDNDISFLGNLVNLEVLRLLHCGIRNLPSAISKLKRLKLLDLTGCVDLCIHEDVFQNLDKLEELYMRPLEGKGIKFTDVNLKGLETLSTKLYALEVEFFKNILEPKNVSFKKLQRFRISIGCPLKEQTDYTIEKYSFKNTLKLVMNRNELSECKINELICKTEELHLSVKDMSYVEDISLTRSQYSTFCNLKVLHVFKCMELTHLFTIPVANSLKQLERLIISSCPELKSVVSLCDSVNVMELPLLVELEFHDLPNFTSIILKNDISTTQPLFNKEVVLPKLRKLTIDRLKRLEQIWACDIASGEEENVSMLRKIKVTNCESLVNLFPRNPMRLLRHLEDLTVEGCCSIETLININLSEQHNMNTSNLRWITVDELEELREVWKINDEYNFGHMICEFQAVETINIKSCKKFRNVFSPTTANFYMGALVDISVIRSGGNNVEMVNNSQEAEITGLSKVAFSSCIRTSNQLRCIDLEGYDGVDVVFEIASSSVNRGLVTPQQQPPLSLFPCLKDLNLQHLNTMSHVWKCHNWNELYILHKHQPQSSFQNLTTIKIIDCKSIKYLFSPLMSKLLSSLKTLEINNCKGMEEIVSNRDDNDDEALTTSTTTLFPSLDNIYLFSLRNLKHIGGGVAKRGATDQFKSFQVVPWSLCEYAREITIKRCSSLSSVIPSNARQMQKLQELAISNCPSMVEVFESNEISNIDQGSVSLPRPKGFTTHHELLNLKKLNISECDLLKYIFTFSTLESLKKLEELSIRSCEALKVIVREENGEESSKVVFPRLKSIIFENLPNLVGFFEGMNIVFEWPSLDYVMIHECPKMMVFTSGVSIAPKLNYIQTRVGKHNLEYGLNFHQISPPSSDSSRMCPSAHRTPWSFHNLIEMDLKYNHELKKIVPSSELLHLQNLETIQISFCTNLEEVFEVTNNESQTVVKLPKLRIMLLHYLKSLKYIWKSNQWRILEFPNLTILRILGCHSLEHVFTTSMIGSLTQLQELHIGGCYLMKVIVKKEKEEECDGKVCEIMFPCLKSFKLEYLSSLEGFCLGKYDFLFPAMNTLVIEDCPELRIFSEGRSIASELKLIKTSFGIFQAREDINSFIKTKIQEGFDFGKLEFSSEELESSSSEELELNSEDE